MMAVDNQVHHFVAFTHSIAEIVQHFGEIVKAKHLQLRIVEVGCDKFANFLV